MADTSLFYWQEMLQKSNPRVLVLEWKITAAKTVQPLFRGLPVYTTFDAISSQSTINNFLGTTNEFTTAQFDATAMGADTFGGLVALQNQGATPGSMVAKCYSSTGGSTIVERGVYASVLADSTLETAYAIGAYGNLGFKINFGNTPDFDGLTDGLIKLFLTWVSK